MFKYIQLVILSFKTIQPRKTNHEAVKGFF